MCEGELQDVSDFFQSRTMHPIFVVTEEYFIDILQTRMHRPRARKNLTDMRDNVKNNNIFIIYKSSHFYTIVVDSSLDEIICVDLLYG
mmetsp:Transcript_2981/g.3995  ORF Transcript_2981/g.3995 Transcript_2981/m.3995 type:complete len:88 (-) Transcript_2981:275-538(-)